MVLKYYNMHECKFRYIASHFSTRTIANKFKYYILAIAINLSTKSISLNSSGPCVKNVNAFPMWVDIATTINSVICIDDLPRVHIFVSVSNFRSLLLVKSSSRRFRHLFISLLFVARILSVSIDLSRSPWKYMTVGLFSFLRIKLHSFSELSMFARQCCFMVTRPLGSSCM